MAPYSQPIAVNPPVYQPMYSQPTFGMGVQPQPGPIIYWNLKRRITLRYLSYF